MKIRRAAVRLVREYLVEVGRLLGPLGAGACLAWWGAVDASAQSTHPLGFDAPVFVFGAVAAFVGFVFWLVGLIIKPDRDERLHKRFDTQDERLDRLEEQAVKTNQLLQSQSAGSPTGPNLVHIQGVATGTSAASATATPGPLRTFVTFPGFRLPPEQKGSYGDRSDSPPSTEPPDDIATP